MISSFFSVSEGIAPGTMILWGAGAGQYTQATAGSTGSVAAPGWLYCDGNTVLVAAYPALYAAIGNRYNTGGEGAGVFRLPGSQSTMWLHTDSSTATEYTAVAASPHSHSLTGVPTVNTLSNSLHSHTSAGNLTSVNNAGHNHGTTTWNYPLTPTNNSNQASTFRVGGSGATVVARDVHSHGINSSSSHTASSHSHPTVSTVPFSNVTHNHTSPSINASVNAGTASHVQPTIAIWHLIKI